MFVLKVFINIVISLYMSFHTVTKNKKQKVSLLYILLKGNPLLPGPGIYVIESLLGRVKVDTIDDERLVVRKILSDDGLQFFYFFIRCFVQWIELHNRGYGV